MKWAVKRTGEGIEVAVYISVYDDLYEGEGGGELKHKLK
jgi:hypothetical protein